MRLVAVDCGFRNRHGGLHRTAAQHMGHIFWLYGYFSGKIYVLDTLETAAHAPRRFLTHQGYTTNEDSVERFAFRPYGSSFFTFKCWFSSVSSEGRKGTLARALTGPYSDRASNRCQAHFVEEEARCKSESDLPNGYSSLVECLPSIRRALGLSYSHIPRKEKKFVQRNVSVLLISRPIALSCKP